MSHRSVHHAAMLPRAMRGGDSNARGGGLAAEAARSLSGMAGPAPATLAPAKPSLPAQVQARAALPKRIVSARHERKTGGTQGARHVAQRAAPRKATSAAKEAAEPARGVAVSKPEVYYLEAQGRPALAVLPVAPVPTKTASVAEVESRHLRQQRRMQSPYAGGHGQPE